MMPEHRIASFNDEGIHEFEALLFEAKGSGMPAQRLQDRCHRLVGTRRFLSPMKPEVAIDDMFPCATRFELAGYLLPRLEHLGVPMQPGSSHRGLWTWLTAAMLWKLIGAGGGKYKIRSLDSYIPSLSSRRWYRHLVSYAVMARHAYGDASIMMLGSKVGVHSDVIEQLQSGSVLGSPGAVDAAYRLFWDSGAESLKTGHAPRDRSIPGLRRFKDKLNQIGCTYDLRKMDSEEIIRFIPEFVERFGLDD